MRKQQEVKITGQTENEEGRVKNRLFQISVREVISMLAGRRSNEESSIPSLRSGFPIASCGVVTRRWLDELSTLSFRTKMGSRWGLLGKDSMYSGIQSHTPVHVQQHMQIIKVIE